MKRHILAGSLVALVLVSMALMGCSPLQDTKAAGQQSTEIQEAVTSGYAAAGRSEETPEPSCANPTPDMVGGCRAQAARILASTVRLEFHGPGGGIGHATVVGGRYLVTHNHYPVSGDSLMRGGEGLVTAVSVFKNNGDIILLKAPLAFFNVVAVEDQALVLDFKAYGGVGFFDSVGVPSIEALPGNADMRPGDEVAQIDWDGSIARVVWSTVTVVNLEGNVAYVELDSFVEHGASGGGVFYNGIHIANNESRRTDRDAATGEIVRRYSVAVLNTTALIAATTGATEIAAVGN